MATKDAFDQQRTDQVKSENEQRRWLVWAIALVALLVFLLVALLTIGIPYFNALLIQDAKFTSTDLASWQITALITTVGMLIGGVFIITAFKVDATAKHTAYTETRSAFATELSEQRKRLDDLISSGTATMENLSGSATVAASEARREVGAAVKQGRSDINSVVNDARIQTTNAINAGSNRFKQATDAALAESQRQFGQSIERIQADGRAVREFIDERAPGLVRESFTVERMDAMRAQLVDRLTEEILGDQVATALQKLMEEQPERFVEPLAERVMAKLRWRWLFRR